MSRGINVVMLLGNVGADPEIRTTTGGNKVATVSLATNRQWKNAAGEKQEATAWHRCIIWNNGAAGGLADVVEKYVRKGDRLHVTGRLEYRSYTDKENVVRYSTEIVVDEVLMLGAPAPRSAPSGEPGK